MTNASRLLQFLLAAIVVPSAGCSEGGSAGNSGEGGSAGVASVCVPPVEGSGEPQANDCKNTLPACSEKAEGGSCVCEGGCVEKPYGRCVESSGQCACEYGCARDGDCNKGTLCFCGEKGGECLPASCKTDEDCPGSSCGKYSNVFCGTGYEYDTGYVCATPQDECATDTDCGFNSVCGFDGGRRKCVFLPSCGRPLLIGASPQSAPLHSVFWG
jgi:hypothetical protein